MKSKRSLSSSILGLGLILVWLWLLTVGSMTPVYADTYGVIIEGETWGLTPAGLRQGNTILAEAQSVYPPRNAVTATLDTTITVTYDEPMDPATVTSRTFAIHGMQSGLVTETHGVVNGNTLIVTPTNSFYQGELVYAIATAGTTNITGTASVATQWQFNAGVVRDRCAHFGQVYPGDLTAVINSSVAWGDYDNDGDLDILLTGQDSLSGNPIAKVYQNTGGGFTEVYPGSLTGVWNGSVAWGDYDNDGDLDILLTGYYWDGSANFIAKLYQNTGGGFSEVYAGSLTGVDYSSVAWGDYDNDGDLDILLTGRGSGGVRMSKVYQNTGSGFTEVYAGSLTAVRMSSAAWGDYDNDGDLDILLTGDDSGFNPIAQVYQNTGDGFTEVHPGSLTAVSNGSVAWGDYDNDGDLDILLTGDDSGYNPITKLYQNTGGGFTEVYTGSLTGVSDSSVAWGDYDNDGDLDILLTGWGGSGGIAKVYQNTGDGFSIVIAGYPTGVRDSSAVWGDYDNDGDLDILLTGADWDYNPIAEVYRNDDCVELQGVYPPRNAVTATLNTTITATYDAEMDASTVTSRTFTIHGMQSGLVTETHGVIEGNTLIVTPANSFHQGELVYAIATAGAANITGTASAAAAQWQFNAGEITNRCVGGFSEVYPGSLTGVGDSSVAWGDYDNDGDLDILLTGGYTAKVYQNTGGGFAEVYAGSLTAVDRSSAAWGDYDNDGDLDILLTGWASGSGGIAKVYQNTGGGFTEVYPGSLTGVSSGSVAWGDYDNDGDLDILLMGEASGGTRIAKVYRNTGGGFSEVYAYSLTNVYGSSAAWGDYDNDGDLDILLTGWAAGGPIAKVYQNTGGGFSEVYAGSLTGVSNGSAAWGDYDNDGDLDILLTGYDSGYNYVSKMYQNTGGGFTEVYAGSLTGVSNGSAAWGDYDNDGDLDILLTGWNDDYIAQVYQNTGGGFTEVHSGSLEGVYNSSVAWGDYDNDGDLDILLTGDAGYDYIAKLYRNDDCADVAISKSVFPATAAPGATITYTIAFSNAAPGLATGVVITDIIPLSMTVQSVASSGALITDTGAVPPYVWDVEDLSTGEWGVITITAVLSDAGEIINTATIASSADGNPANNSSSAILTVYPLLPIYDIQFVPDPVADDASPWLGEMVWTEGVVIADGEVFGSNTRYYIEDPAGGPWSGLYIYNGGDHPLVAEGDLLRLLGLVDEYNGVTQLSILNSAGGLQQVLSSGNPLPAPEIIASGVYTPGGTATAEAYESVLIEFQLTTVISDNLGYGEWAFDDGSGEAHADDWSDYLTYVPALGDYTTYLRGVGNYSFGDYKLVPRYDLDVSLVSPTLHVSPAAFDVTLDPAAVATHTLSLSNSGSLLDWSLAQVPGVVWLETSPITGSLMPLDSANVDVVFSAPLAAGVYNTDLEIYSNDPGAPTVTVPVSLTVNNLPPVADDDTFIVDEDSMDNPLDVLDGDTDGNGDTLTVDAVGTPDQGGTVLNAGSHVTYTPALDFYGSETFTYTISDGNGGLDTATVVVTVTNVNDLPDALDDGYTVPEDSSANALDLLANDSYLPDPPETLTISVVGTPDQGGSVVNAGSYVTYTPALNFYGSETFTYTISDGNGGFDTATVVVTLTNVNDPPDALDDGYTVLEDSPDNALDLLANDSYLPDPPEVLTISAVGPPDQGGTVLNAGSHVTYTPALDFYGTESFTYTMSDGNGGLDTATVVVTVTSVNDAPVAADEAYTTSFETVLLIAAPGVLANDSDVEGDSLTALLVSGPPTGTLLLSSDGSFIYTPTLDWSGLITLTYYADDGMDASNLATVTIEVLPPAVVEYTIYLPVVFKGY